MTGVLRCQHCGFDHLCHKKVEVFERTEDAGGLHVTVNGDVLIDTNMNGNPSSRRHGLSVHFECESCDGETTLSISQHKGTTYLDVRKSEASATAEK